MKSRSYSEGVRPSSEPFDRDSFPDVELHISSPQELAAVVRQIKECLTSGALRQLHPSGAPLSVDDFSRVPEAGPWPDYLEAHFEDGQGRRYKLAAETFHGAGGSWSRE